MFTRYTTSNKELTVDDISAKDVKAAIDWNKKTNGERLKKLYDYYLGEHEILERQTSSGVNNKVVVNHAKYITDINIGYLLGNPVGYTATAAEEGKDEPDIEPVLDEYKDQTINDLDSEIAKDVSIFGYQYEYIYNDEDAFPRSIDIDNNNIVLIRDTTIKHNKVAAIIYHEELDPEGKLTGYRVYVVDRENVIEYTTDKDVKTLTIAEAKRPHAMGEVPVIEYKNNPEYQGDFEQVIPLIDAYNLLQSDRINDKEQLVDAILAFYGMDFTAEQAIALKEGRMIANIPTDGKVEFLTKQLDEADTDVLRKTIEADIFKVTMTPNMSDENFVGNSSGVAIRYKLLAFEQNTKNKERYLERGLLERFRIYNHFLTIKKNMAEIRIRDVDANFTRNLPTNDYEISQMINNLIGIVDRESLIGQLSFVDDPAETLKKVDAEEQEKSAASATDISTGLTTDANDETDLEIPPTEDEEQNLDEE